MGGSRKSHVGLRKSGRVYHTKKPALNISAGLSCGFSYYLSAGLGEVPLRLTILMKSLYGRRNLSICYPNHDKAFMLNYLR